MSPDAARIKAEICRTAEQRTRCWMRGDASTAAILSMQLAQDWQLWRTVNAAASGDGRTMRDPSKGTRIVQAVDDPLERFLAANCVLDSEAVATVREVHDAYQAWAVHELEDSISPMRLTLQLRARGIETTRTRSTRMYRGLRVTASAETPLATAA